MSKDRREFLKQSALGLAATAIAPQATATAETKADPQAPPELPPGAPPAFGTGPRVGPEVTPQTFAEAEKLMQVQLTESEREQAARSWQVSMAGQYQRRNGPKKIAIDPETAPATIWDPSKIPGAQIGARQDRFQTTRKPPRPLPSKEEDIAYAGILDQAHWIETKQLTSQRLTSICLDRLERFQPKITPSSPSPRTWPLSRQEGPTRRSQRETTRAPSTASPGAPRTSSTPRASPPRTAPSRTRTGYRRRTRQSSTGWKRPAQYWSPS
jgi:hypothetical protein